MNKNLLFSIFMLLPLVCIHADDIIIDPINSSEIPMKKTPIHVPSVTLEGYILTFDSTCIGCPVLLIQDDTIVYTAIVDENGTIVLPDNLAGVFELQLQRGSVTFVGEMEL